MLASPGFAPADRRADTLAIIPEGTGPPRNLPAEIFRAAAGAYLAGQRLDMQSLARRVGVGRATLYRRVGNREQLLDAVIWWRARRLLAWQLGRSCELAGAARISAVVGGVLRSIERDRPLRAFLDCDTDTALRILTGGRGQAAHGLTIALERLIDRERSLGAFEPDLDTAALAYAIMRISEAFLYADVLAGLSPDVSRAITVVDALLAGLDRAARR
ncbi:MAG: QsdR family transcriptional regulator [Streptosporangiaceae bacterium]